MIKLNVGAGFEIKPSDQGWVNIDGNDNEGVDLVLDLGKQELPYPVNSIDHILAKNIIEHISRHKQMEFIVELYRVLKVGGTITIEMPNLKCIAESYLGIRANNNPNLTAPEAAAFLFGAQEDEFGCHRWIYDIPAIMDLLQSIGFVVYYTSEARGTNLICKAIKSNCTSLEGAVIDYSFTDAYYIVELCDNAKSLAIAIKLANYKRVFCYGDFPEFEHENIMVIRNRDKAPDQMIYRSVGYFHNNRVLDFPPSLVAINLSDEFNIDDTIRNMTKLGSGVFVWVGGGIGDVIQVYLSTLKPNELPSSSKVDTDWFRRLPHFKEVNPETKVALIIQSPNPFVSDLFLYYPYIDEVINLRWETPYDKSFKKDIDSYQGMVHLRHRYNVNDYQQQDTMLCLSDDDEAIIASFRLPEQYMVIHPFAGNPEREPLNMRLFAKLVDKIANIMPVVILGASYSTLTDRPFYHNEMFPCVNNSSVLDLVGKVNLRVGIALTQRAYKFIGTHSSMILAAWQAGVESLCFIPEFHDTGVPYREYINKNNRTTWGLYKDGFKTIMIESPSDFNIDEVMEWVRNGS